MNRQGKEQMETRLQPAYAGSLAEAKKRDEVEQWKESRRLRMELSFKAKSSVARNLTVGLEGANNSSLFSETFSAGTDWQTYTYTFSPSASNNSAKQLFFMLCAADKHGYSRFQNRRGKRCCPLCRLLLDQTSRRRQD